MLYVYAAGTYVNGVYMEEEAVRPAAPFTDLQGNQHSEAVLTSWEPERLALAGVKTWGEDIVPNHYRGGIPEDIRTNTHVQRTYPNPIFEPEPWVRQLKEMAKNKMKQKRDGGFLVNDILFDSDANANVAYLNINSIFANDKTYTQRWKASGETWVTMDVLLFLKVAAGFAQCNSSAYNWLEQITNMIEAAGNDPVALAAAEAKILE